MSTSIAQDHAARAPAGLRLHPRLQSLLAWLIVFAGLLVLNAPALNGKFLWDDNDNRNIAGRKTGNKRPPWSR